MVGSVACERAIRQRGVAAVVVAHPAALAGKTIGDCEPFDNSI